MPLLTTQLCIPTRNKEGIIVEEKGPRPSAKSVVKALYSTDLKTTTNKQKGQNPSLQINKEYAGDPVRVGKYHSFQKIDHGSERKGKVNSH